MSPTNLARASSRAGCRPFLIHAADFGWVHKARMIWCACSPQDFAKVPHTTVHSAESLLDSAHVVRWIGPQQPRILVPEHVGATWAFKGQCGRRGVRTGAGPWFPAYADGRFLTFTSSFYREADIGDQEDPEMVARFLTDGRRFPLSHYTAGNMLQLPHGSLRPLTALERERLMGLPDHFTRDLEHPEDSYWHESSLNARMSAIRNGWHVPSIMIFIMSMLLSCAPEQRQCEFTIRLMVTNLSLHTRDGP